MKGRLLVVEDDAALREALCDTLRLEGYEIHEAVNGAAALEALARAPADAVVSDVCMDGLDGPGLLRRMREEHPAVPVLLMTAFATVDQAVEMMRLGATDYLMKPFDTRRLVEKLARIVPAGDDDGFVAEDPKSRELRALAARVAATEATVLLYGPSGTGKEVLARFIHRQSPRAAGPFVAVNCAAIPDNMLEAMLFGYEKGAFTGAHQAAPGKFEQAQGGTLLLDEVSEMPLALQAKLLRVLQEREVERLGGRRAIALDVRVLATTNRRLREEVSAGRFREDLYYRLNVFPIALGPLAERPDDILPLARRLLARGGDGKVLSAAAEARLLAHRWPGNVRELDNALQRAAVLAAGREIGPDDLMLEGAPAPAAAAPQDLSEALLDRECAEIGQALRGTSRREAAQRLGISERTLRYKIAKLKDSGRAVIPGALGAESA